MKPKHRKLTVRRETLRQLVARDLAHACGGQNDTGQTTCPGLPEVESEATCHPTTALALDSEATCRPTTV